MRPTLAAHAAGHICGVGAVAMTQADRDAQPKRLSPLQEALSGESMVYHRLVSRRMTSDDG